MNLPVQFTEHVASGQSRSHHPIVFLIHGGASSGRMYDDVFPRLNEQGLTVIVPDLPGHGKTAISARLQNLHDVFSFSSATKSLYDLVQDSKQRYPSTSIVIVGISLGGQVVLDLITKYTSIVQAAIVSGASIHPPNDVASWEMPRLPTESERWMRILAEDVEAMGLENAHGVQDASFNFNFEIPDRTEAFPPTLLIVGEHDIPMAKRDLEELTVKIKQANPQSESQILNDAWHNHSVDIPDRFADVIMKWIRKCEL